MPRPPVALTIAGSDSGGGAGIQADLKTFSALGAYGASVLTAITAQNTLGVTAVFEIPTDVILAQIDAVVTDMRPDAYKTGMIASIPIIEAVAERLRHYRVERLVVDPVMVAKGGHPLLRPEAVAALRKELLPLALVATPNLPEAEVLLDRKIETLDQMRDAARAIVEQCGARSVVVKGGHREGPAVDVFYDGAALREFESERIETQNTHGTGCTFASAIATYLARGESLPTAIERAKRYVTEAIRRAPEGIGAGHGPVHHFWRCWEMLQDPNGSTPTPKEGPLP